MATRQTANVSLPPEIAEIVEGYARTFHRGKFAAAARVLIEEGLRHVTDETTYLQAMKRSNQKDTGAPVGNVVSTPPSGAQSSGPDASGTTGTTQPPPTVREA